MSASEKTGKKKNLRGVVILLMAVGGFYLVVNSAMSKGDGQQTEGTLYNKTPSQLAEETPQEGARVRLAGTVVIGSYAVSDDGRTHTFSVSDDEASVAIEYTGVLPDMFEQGKQVMATGDQRKDGSILAKELSTKCPSKYEGGASEEAEKRSLQYDGKSK